MSKLRIAVIGGGHLGKIHAKLLSKDKRFQLVAVADPSHAARKSVSDLLSVSTVADYHVLAGSIDAVVIASPTSLHFSMATWALRHGLHTLVEKPLVHSSREADLLVRLARDQDCVLQVGHVERFNPAWVAARKHIVEPRLLESTRTSTYTGRSTDIGVVLDLMIHDLDLVLQAACSQIDRVDATGWSVLGQHEDFAEARIQFTNGCVANLKASRVSPTQVRSMHVHCRRATTSIDFGSTVVEVMTPSQEVAQGRFQADLLPQEARQEIRNELFTRLIPIEKLEVVPCNAIECELGDFHRAIQTGDDPQVTGEDASNTIALAEQILSCIRYNAAGIAIPSRDTLPIRRAA